MRVRFGDCVLDTDTRELFRKEKAVHLPPTAFRLLELLVESRPKVLSKDQIHEKVWPGTFISEATLASAISDIRIAIGDTGKKPRFIRTVHGYGYAFKGEAAEGTAPAIVGTGCTVLWRDCEIPLRSGETLIGRGPRVGIVVQDDSVSRQHARILVGDGSARLEDLGSKNGTFVNTARVTQARPLIDGDEIRLGDVTMTFRRVSEETSTRTV